MTMVVQASDVGSSNRRRWILLVAVVLVVAAVVLLWFQPQKLLIDERVDEPLPEAASVADQPPPPGSASGVDMPIASAPEEPVDRYRGQFISRDHGTSGVVRIVELADGRRIVRLEGLETDNGPDLYLYLSTNPADGPEGDFDEAYVNLGRLQGNLGDQNYDVPEDVDPARYQSVVIWCDRFDSAFGAASVRPA